MPARGSLTVFWSLSYTDRPMSQGLIQLGRQKKAAPPSGSGKKTTVGFVNLGCTKNQVDSEIMLGTLAADGFELTGNPKKAEVVIINTCGFIEEAKQESINSDHGAREAQAIGRLPGADCRRLPGPALPRRFAQRVPELDGVVGTGEFGTIAVICRDLLAPKDRRQRLWISQPPYLYDEMAPRLRLGTPHSAYVKIAEGCNRNCAFCAIPLMRGKQRSRPVESIVAEVRQLAGEGVKEINLISQDTVNYGVDLGLRQGLVSLAEGTCGGERPALDQALLSVSATSHRRVPGPLRGRRADHRSTSTCRFSTSTASCSSACTAWATGVPSKRWWNASGPGFPA